MTWQRIPLLIVGLSGVAALSLIGLFGLGASLILPARATEAIVATLALPAFLLLSIPVSISFFLATGGWLGPVEIVREQMRMLRYQK